MANCEMQSGEIGAADKATLEFRWDCGTPPEEWELGSAIGRSDALYEFSDRDELLSLLAALELGSLEFVKRLQRTKFMASGEAAHAPVDDFIAHMFGADAGGLYGEYAQAYIAEFEQLRPFVKSLH